VERVLPGEQATELVAQDLEIWEIVLVAGPAPATVRALGQEPAIVRVAEPDAMHARERGLVPAEAARMLDPVPAPALVSAGLEATSAIAVSHRVRVSVRAATHLVAADLAAALRDQPAVEEAIAWAGVASAAEADAAVEVVAAVEAVGDNRRKSPSLSGHCGDENI
jgi:hypothetical protein